MTATHNEGITEILWEGVATGGTIPTYRPQRADGIMGSIHAVGTWGGATIVLRGSNNGTDWVALNDPLGNPISLTANGAFEFATAMKYIYPYPTGGSSDDVDVYVTMRRG